MNKSILQRLASLALVSLTAVPLCVLFITSAAQAASTAAPSAAPSAAVSSASSSGSEDPEHDEDGSDWQDRSESPDHHDKHGHRGHHGSDLVNLGHDSSLPQGQRADSVVSIFGSSTSDGDAGNVISILGDTRVTGEVSDGAVSVFGNTYIDGKIHGDAVAVLGNMELGPHAEIGGDVVAVGGTLTRDPAAIVHGGVQNIFAGDFGGLGWLRSWIRHCLLYGRPLAFAPGLGWAWGLAFTFLAIYAGLALLFREGLTRCVQTFETQPGRTVLAALIAMLLTPVLVVLLFVTVIGIAAVPFVLFGLFCAGMFGKAVMLAWVGQRVTSARTAGSVSHPAVAVIIGGILVTALYLVPVLGFLVYKLLGFLGLGAVVYTAILAVRARQAVKEDGPRRSSAAARNTTQTIGEMPAPGAAAPSPGPDAAEPPRAEPRQPPPQQPPASPSVTAAMPRAGFWVRMMALLLDALLVGFLMGVLHHAYHLELLVLAAYGAVMWKMRGSTIGGIVFDLHVVRLDGRQIDWETAIVRALSCFLSLAVAGLGFIWIAFDADNQAWHDKIAGTVVVRVVKGVPLV
jgi:uncharacterized RDD family membrane protein YckC/UPF0716 family protein affecting phage T7 exclusion